MSVARPIRIQWKLFTEFRTTPGKTPKPQRACLSTTRPLEEDRPRVKPKDLTIKSAITYDILERAEALKIPIPLSLQEPSATIPEPRLPRSVQALYLAPLRRTPTHGIPVCNLQLRSYSVRNVEFVADFALRAAYYLNLPARGPVPLPRITERWTVPRSNFIYKKSQENWERITLRRLVQIQDGHPEVVQRWLGFVRKWCWYGVGMKADVWEWEGLETGRRMDENDEAVERGVESVNWELFGRRNGMETEEEVRKLMERTGLGGEGNVPRARQMTG